MKRWRRKAACWAALAVIVGGTLMPLEGIAYQKLQRGDPDEPVTSRTSVPRKPLILVFVPTPIGTFSIGFVLSPWIIDRGVRFL